MNITYSQKFLTHFKKLSRDDKRSTQDTINFFRDDPHHPSLRNHPLTGSLSGYHAISVRDDLRIIFRERWDYVEVVMTDIGSHETVYHP